MCSHDECVFTEQINEDGMTEETKSDTEESPHIEIAPPITSPLGEINIDEDTSLEQTGSATSQITQESSSLEQTGSGTSQATNAGISLENENNDIQQEPDETSRHEQS